MYSKILLTLDGSELSKAAIPHAAQLARDTDTEVVILEVIDPSATALMRTVTAAFDTFTAHSSEEMEKSANFIQKRDAGRHLEEAAAALKEAGVRNVTSEIREGDPGNEILDTASSRGCGAVVMATRGHSGLGREVAGSVAEYVLRHAGATAVVLVGPRGATAEGG